MKPAYFISDLHLGCDSEQAIPDREERIVKLFRAWQGQASHVILVGDVFEFWMEYRHYVNRHHFRFMRALAELVESGVEVHYLSGNHDFRLDAFFPETLGVQVHAELVLELQGKRVFFCHGDGRARKDLGYRLVKRLLHSPLDVFLFRLLHPDLGMAIAKAVGSTSRNMNEHKALKVGDYAGFVRAALRSRGCNAVVHGHVHEDPGVWQYPEGEHVNCGQWLFELDYVEMRDGAFRVVRA